MKRGETRALPIENKREMFTTSTVFTILMLFWLEIL